MHIQEFNIKWPIGETATIELFISDLADISELPQAEYLEARLTVPYDPDPRVLQVQLAALQKLQILIGEQIDAIRRIRAQG